MADFKFYYKDGILDKALELHHPLITVCSRLVASLRDSRLSLAQSVAKAITNATDGSAQDNNEAELSTEAALNFVFERTGETRGDRYHTLFKPLRGSWAHSSVKYDVDAKLHAIEVNDIFLEGIKGA